MSLTKHFYGVNNNWCLDVKYTLYFVHTRLGTVGYNPSRDM
jgi:hypothetical protein